MGKQFRAFLEPPTTSGCHDNWQIVLTTLSVLHWSSDNLGSKKAISKLKRNKAAGLDTIHPELYLEGGNAITRNTTQLLQSIWSIKSMPYKWKAAVEIPLTKMVEKPIAGITEESPF